MSHDHDIEIPPPLPPLLREIARVAGLPAALALGSERVGRVYIPGRDRLRADHWLVQLVGAEAAAALADAFGETPIEISPALSGQARQRRRAMRLMLEDGASLNEVCRALGVDRSTVRRAKKRLRRRPAPLPLFGE